MSVLVLFSGYLVFAGQADRLHRYSIRAQWQNLNVIHYQNSQYGNIGITEPSTLQANRFFTKEFFSLVKAKLDKGGILALGLPGSLTYSNEELKNLNGCIFNTLKSVFPYVKVVPGDGTNLFFSSDSQEILWIDKGQIIERLNQRSIKAEVIIPWYIEQKLHPGWQAWFSDFIEGSSQKINSDFNPIGVFYSISHWNALFAPALRWLFRQFERINLGVIVLLFALFLVLYFLFRPRSRRFFRTGISLAIITTGFAGMIFDLMLIFTFQSVYGYVFSWIGLLVASFMAGVACGAMLIAAVLERIENCFKVFIKLAAQSLLRYGLRPTQDAIGPPLTPTAAIILEGVENRLSKRFLSRWTGVLMIPFHRRGAEVAEPFEPVTASST